MQQLAWLLKAAVSAVMFGLAAIPLVVIVTTWVSAPSSSVQLADPASVPDARASQDKPCSPTQLALFLHLSKLDIVDESLDVDVSGCVGQDDAYLVRGRTKHPRTIVSIPGLDSTLSLGLTDLNAVPQHLGAVSIPINGDPRRYPLDVYRTTIPLSIDAPSQALYQSLTIQVRADPGVGGFNWSFARPLTGYTYSPNRLRTVFISQPLAVKAARPAGTQLFVLCLVLVPFVLGVLAVPLLWTRPRTVDGLVGVTGIMLAILPIRTVLVPGEIGSLTLVDFALGSEMALLAASTAFVFLWPGVRDSVVSRLGSGAPPAPEADANGTRPRHQQPAVLA